LHLEVGETLFGTFSTLYISYEYHLNLFIDVRSHACNAEAGLGKHGSSVTALTCFRAGRHCVTDSDGLISPEGRLTSRMHSIRSPSHGFDSELSGTNTSSKMSGLEVGSSYHILFTSYPQKSSLEMKDNTPFPKVFTL